MKIVFICGGLEPGRDGVGDYVRRMASELVRQGNAVAAVAINDREVTAQIEGTLTEEGAAFPWLRLPASWSAKQRFEQAGGWIKRFQPDWISLQFVIYSFDRRGLPFGLGEQLGQLIGIVPCHIMFHELWVLWGMRCRLRDRLSGVLQRRIILTMLRRIQPAVIHVSIPLYQAILRDVGFQAGLLPLPANIARVKSDAKAWLGPQLARVGAVDYFSHRDKYYSFGLFGTIFGNWEPIPLMAMLAELHQATGRRILVFAGGRLGRQGEKVFAKMQAMAGQGLNLLHLAEMEAGCISEYLNSIDFGVVCYSAHFFGKSSAGATMLGHGLPIVIAGAADRFRPELQTSCSDGRLIPLDGNFIGNIVGARKYESTNGIEALADTLLHDLRRAMTARELAAGDTLYPK